MTAPVRQFAAAAAGYWLCAAVAAWLLVTSYAWWGWIVLAVAVAGAVAATRGWWVLRGWAREDATQPRPGVVQ